MKKLMITAAATLCAAVSLADISSANIVGYAEKGLNTAAGKYNYICGQFQTVGVDRKDMTVGSLAPNSKFEFDNDKIMIFNSDGNVEYSLYYASQQDLIDNDILLDFPEAKPGWYTVQQVDGDWDFSTDANSTPLPMGSMIVVTSKNSGAGLLSSGEVVGDDLPLDLNTAAGKYNYVGNCSPVQVDWEEIKPNAKFEFDNDKVLIFNDEGNVEHSLYYASQQDLIDNDILVDFPDAKPGWYTVQQVDGDWDFTTSMNKLPCPAGQAFVVTSKNSGAQIVIPAAY